MKRTEFETQLVSLEADYARDKVNVENLINEIYEEMDTHEQKMVECKGRIRNLRHNIEQMKAKFLEEKAKLFIEFESDKGSEK